MSFSGTVKTANTRAACTEIARLAGIIWREHYTPIIGDAQVEYMLEQGYTVAALAAEQSAGSQFLIAWSNGEAVGYAGWTPDSDKCDLAWLDKFYVLREARGAGAGSALLKRIAAASGGVTLKLRVNRHNTVAIAAYQRLGFMIQATDIKSIGGGFVMDDYIMRRAPSHRQPSSGSTTRPGG